jgi:hypothetical protein
LSKQPGERFARANDLADALISVLSREDTAAAQLRGASVARLATPTGR